MKIGALPRATQRLRRGKNLRRSNRISHNTNKLRLRFWFHIAAFYNKALGNFLAQQQPTRARQRLEKFRKGLQQRKKNANAHDDFDWGQSWGPSRIVVLIKLYGVPRA